MSQKQKTIIEEINASIESAVPNESLAAILKDIMEKQLTDTTYQKNYNTVTELVNPTQTYYSIKNPNIRKTPEIARKLARGKQLHGYAGVWFRSLPEFIVEEGLLDGVWVDIPGVRGSIDYRIGDSIIEFKTKDRLPNTEEDIVSLYPHDLEQLVFYSVIHPSNPKSNYLVFMKNAAPYKIKVFKVEINDFGAIKTFLLARIKLLGNALTNNDPSKLGKCRYFEGGCQYNTNSICSCSKFEGININRIIEKIKISGDESFTKTLEKARDESNIPGSICLTTFNIIAPRKHYMENISGVESSYKEDDTKEQYKACLWISVKNLASKLRIDLTPPERIGIIKSQLELRVWIGFRWIRLKSSTKPDGEIVPYLIKVNMSDKVPRSPQSYYIAELGIVCATYGINKGLIFIVYPKLNKLIQVIQVTYRDIDKILTKIRERINLVERAMKENNLLLLPPCEEFLNNQKTCPLMKECNIKKESGCVK